MRQSHPSCLARVSRPSGPAAFGFTLIELLITMAVFFVIAAMVAPVLPASLVSRDLESSAALAVDALRQAQGNAMTGRGLAVGGPALRWGVHFQADRFVVFSGPAYSAGAADNIATLLNGRVRISAVALSGGSCTVATGAGNCDVHFAQIEGMPTEAGTVTLVNAGNSAEAKTVTVNAAGLTDFQ